jgi:hypothetical protein
MIKLISFLSASIGLLLQSFLFAQDFHYDNSFQVRGGLRNYTHALQLANNGNLIHAGDFTGTIDLDLTSDSTFFSSKGNSDGYLHQFTPNGNPKWSYHFGGKGSEHVTTIISDSNSNIFFTGTLSDSCDFNLSGSPQYLSPEIGVEGVFIAQLDSSGNLNWVKAFGGTEFCRIDQMKLDAQGNIWILGFFSGQMDFDPSPAYQFKQSSGSDKFILKLDPNGNFITVKTFPSTSPFGGGTSIGFLPNGEMIYSGSFRDELDLNPGGVGLILTSRGQGDAFVVKFDMNFSPLWSQQIGGPGKEHCDVMIRKNGELLLTGNFTDSLTIATTTGNYLMKSKGQHDAFIITMDSQGNIMDHRNFGGLHTEGIRSPLEDEKGQLYFYGSFGDSVLVDPAFPPLVSFGGPNAFILQMDSSNNIQWIKQISSNRGMFSSSLLLTANQELYFSGWFFGDLYCDPDTAVVSMSAPPGTVNVFINRWIPKTTNSLSENQTERVRAYPNPSNGKLHLDFGTLKNSGCIQVYSSTGKLIQSIDNSTNQLVLDLPANPGIYFVQITASNYSQTIKVVRE